MSTIITWVAVVVGAYGAAIAAFLTIFYLMPIAGRRWSPRAKRLRAFLWEWSAAVATQWLLLIPLLWWPWWYKKGRGRPIILVHGYGQTSIDFMALAFRLRHELHRPVWAFDYWFFSAPDRCAARLARFVERVRRQNEAAEVDLVCHSYGGIVSRYLVERIDASPVRNLVMVATPHRGTWWAKLGPGRSSHAMSPNNVFVAEFWPPSPPESVSYYGVRSEADAVVAPPNNAGLENAGTELVMTDRGHLGLLFSKRVASQIAKWLENDPC
ncbi:MAG: alpha/beta fold hydrolase [Deltaproteobacteria bacterium]|nr:alpha/beta fold hydrolase [Deltaproteobacteria bacterium]